LDNSWFLLPQWTEGSNSSAVFPVTLETKREEESRIVSRIVLEGGGAVKLPVPVIRPPRLKEEVGKEEPKDCGLVWSLSSEEAISVCRKVIFMMSYAVVGHLEAPRVVECT
jgi:hypothetical protein